MYLWNWWCITSSSCTRVWTYLRFKLWFEPSAYLYLRTSSKTKDCHLGLLQSLLVPLSSLTTHMPRSLLGVHTHQGSQVPSRLVLVSRSALVLSQPSDIIDLVPSCLVSTDPTLSLESLPHLLLPNATIRTYTTDFYLFLCTNTGVIATHALSFYRPLAPLSCWLMRSSLLWLRAAPYCTLLRTVTYCCSDAIVLVTPIVRVTLLFSYST